jgi:hypothetical protein
VVVVLTVSDSNRVVVDIDKYPHGLLYYNLFVFVSEYVVIWGQIGTLVFGVMRNKQQKELSQINRKSTEPLTAELSSEESDEEDRYFDPPIKSYE